MTKTFLCKNIMIIHGNLTRIRVATSLMHIWWNRDSKVHIECLWFKNIPPKASPMHCNPMHTPNKGISGPSSSTVCNDIPESCGAPVKRKMHSIVLCITKLILWRYNIRSKIRKNQDLTWSGWYKNSPWIFPVKWNIKYPKLVGYYQTKKHKQWSYERKLTFLVHQH